MCLCVQVVSLFHTLRQNGKCKAGGKHSHSSFKPNESWQQFDNLSESKTSDMRIRAAGESVAIQDRQLIDLLCYSEISRKLLFRLKVSSPGRESKHVHSLPVYAEISPANAH